MGKEESQHKTLHDVCIKYILSRFQWSEITSCNFKVHLYIVKSLSYLPLFGTISSMSSQKPLTSSFYENLPQGEKNEVFEALVKTDKILIERIVSEGQTSETWYDQEEDEFCCVLRGAAELIFEGVEEPIPMDPGTWVMIPAHTKHKVSRTHESEQTIWIAIKWKA